MADAGTAKQLARRTNLASQLSKLSRRAQALMAAGIAERLLPAAKEPLTAWRSNAWTTQRWALDRVWDYLDGSVAPMQGYEGLREVCIENLPHSEDPNWSGGANSVAAVSAVVNTLDILIGSDPEAALYVSDEAIHAIEVYLSNKMFPDATLGSEVDYEVIFESNLMQAEIQRVKNHLDHLVEVDGSEEGFRIALKQIREESKNNPIVFR